MLKRHFQACLKLSDPIAPESLKMSKFICDAIL